MTIKNSKGTVFYGMHFYPGVAEYKEPQGAFRVFLNENTIRAMGPSFAGRPVYVMHVDDVPEDLDRLRAEADGWVSESFFNEADGKHWVKFLVVSEKGHKAIESGYRLSNCYMPKTFDRGGEWNGVSYQKEVTGGEYEHLAIVPNPRYEESVIMTPEQFKAYNEAKRVELQRLANDNGGSEPMLKIFKRTAVENSKDLENVLVLLPKSGREVAITTLVNEADEHEQAKGKPRLANMVDTVKVKTKNEKGEEVEEVMTVEALRNAYQEKCNADDDDALENEDDDDALENEDDMDPMENEDDDTPPKKEEKDDKKENKKKNKKKNSAEGSERARALHNAHQRGNFEDQTVLTYDPTGGVARGKARYGS